MRMWTKCTQLGDVTRNEMAMQTVMTRKELPMLDEGIRVLKTLCNVESGWTRSYVISLAGPEELSKKQEPELPEKDCLQNYLRIVFCLRSRGTG